MNSLPKTLRLRSAHRRTGFTLLEIMLVVMIIALLATVAISNMGDMFGQAQETTAVTTTKQLETALLTYRAKAGNYPTTAQGLAALKDRPSGDPQPMSWVRTMKEIPLDPWGAPFEYRRPGTHNPDSYDIFSKGKDGQAGTDDDIGNWKSSN